MLLLLRKRHIRLGGKLQAVRENNYLADPWCKRSEVGVGWLSRFFDVQGETPEVDRRAGGSRRWSAPEDATCLSAGGGTVLKRTERDTTHIHARDKTNLTTNHPTLKIALLVNDIDKIPVASWIKNAFNWTDLLDNDSVELQSSPLHEVHTLTSPGSSPSLRSIFFVRTLTSPW